MVKFNIKKHHLIEKEFSFELETVNVSTNVRRLRATWTPELAQDVSAFHNIDAEAELTVMLSEQVASEIDREIIRNLYNMSSIPSHKEGLGGITPTRNIKKHHFVPKKETDFSDFTLPLARRVTAMTMGMDSVVPMAQPTGNLFYLDYSYGNLTEPTVNDDGSWYKKNIFGSTLINFELKPHIFINKPTRVRRPGRRRPTRPNRR